MKTQGTARAKERISDAAVQAKTGKTWQEWFGLLDAAGAQAMSHPEIARHLQEKEGVPDWWCQMVANTYEQAQGVREKHQMPEGYQISVSKTLEIPASELYRAWTDESMRRRWLADVALTIRKATASKSLRITWGEDDTSVEVLFYPKGESRSQVVVQHSKLADADQAEGMKSYWRGALERLKEVVGA